MPFRFRRTVRLAPGLRLNLGKRSVSVSAGVRGAHATFGGPAGRRLTVGLPGSGLFYTTTTAGRRRRRPHPLAATAIILLALYAAARWLF